MADSTLQARPCELALVASPAMARVPSTSAWASGSTRRRSGDDCLLVLAGDEAVLRDPSYTQEELESLRAEVENERASAVHVLVTHADYDHVCGLGSFPGATVVAVAGTVWRVEDGSAGDGPQRRARSGGSAWSLDGRIDRTVDVGEVQLGAFPVDVVDAPSHGREGAAFVLPDQGILFAGDHLSPITIPLLAGSLQAAVAANEALLDALDRHELRWIVPGHGRVLSPAEAREIGQADLEYLQVSSAPRGRLSSGGWRPATPSSMSTRSTAPTGHG